MIPFDCYNPGDQVQTTNPEQVHLTHNYIIPVHSCDILYLIHIACFKTVCEFLKYLKQEGLNSCNNALILWGFS